MMAGLILLPERLVCGVVRMILFNQWKCQESGLPFTVKDYINPADPNHLHYYIWRWYSQIAGGSDEVIRHAIKGERGNDILVSGPGITGNEQYKISSYNRTKKCFTVLIYSSGANGTGYIDVSIPSTIQNGKYYNNEPPKLTFGERVSRREQV